LSFEEKPQVFGPRFMLRVGGISNLVQKRKAKDPRPFSSNDK
jgi:hypothetical protein